MPVDSGRDGNLSAAVRTLLHRKAVTKALTDAVDAQVKLAIAPVAEALDRMPEIQGKDAKTFGEFTDVSDGWSQQCISRACRWACPF